MDELADGDKPCKTLQPSDISMTSPPTASALERLKEAIRLEAAALGQSRADTLARDPRAISSWREQFYRQLLISRPGFEPEAAARMAVELSKDSHVAAHSADQMAIAACRLLDVQQRGAGGDAAAT